MKSARYFTRLRQQQRLNPMNEAVRRLHQKPDWYDSMRRAEQRLPMVEERMRSRGFKGDRAISFSVAKYWDTMEKLAAE